MSYQIEEIHRNKIMVPVTIVNKRHKSGWFSENYYVTMRSLVDDFSSKYGSIWEIPCRLEQYYDLNVGDTIKVAFYKHSNGKWYTTSE